MKLILLDPVSRDPVSAQWKSGDPVLPVLENAKGDRPYRLVVQVETGSTQSFNMQADPFVDHGTVDLEGAYPATGSGEQQPAAPVTLSGSGVANFTVLGSRGAIKAGEPQKVQVIDTVSINLIA